LDKNRSNPIHPKNSLFIAFRFLAEFSARASTIITFPLMARYLGTEGYGVNSQTNALVTFLVPIATLGLGFGVVRLISGTQSVKSVTSRLFSTITVVSLTSAFLSLIIILLAPVINQLFIKVDWAPSIIRWSAPLILLSAVELTIKDYYRARLRIISYSVFQILQTIVYVGGVAFILTGGGGLLQVIWLWLGIKLIFNLATFIYFLTVGEIEVRFWFMPKDELIGLLRFGFPTIVAGLGMWVTNLGDRWVIGYFLTIRDVAVYNAAYTLAGVITALASPFWNPLYPLMSSYFNDNNLPALFRATRKYTNGFTLVTLPAVAGLTILANPLLVHFGSSDFSIQPLTFGLIILGLFIDQLSACFHYQIYLHNDPHFIRNAVLISGGANIVLNIISVPFMGILGAAAATFISFLILDYLLFRRVISYGIRIRDMYDFSTLAKYLVSTVFMAIIILFAVSRLEANLAMLVEISILGAVLYFISLFAIYSFNLKRLISSI
jgi:O-antigen/teichoic acid export membrane protein